MSCLGSYFALTAEDAERFLQAHQRGKSDRLAWLHEYETQNFASLNVAGWVEMTDRAWDAIHRCLTDGKLELGTTPRHLCVLGPNEQYFIRRNDGELEYIVNLLEPADVRRVVDAVRGIDEAEMRSGYEGIDPDSFYATASAHK